MPATWLMNCQPALKECRAWGHGKNPSSEEAVGSHACPKTGTLRTKVGYRDGRGLIQMCRGPEEAPRSSVTASPLIPGSVPRSCLILYQAWGFCRLCYDRKGLKLSCSLIPLRQPESRGPVRGPLQFLVLEDLPRLTECLDNSRLFTKQFHVPGSCQKLGLGCFCPGGFELWLRSLHSPMIPEAKSM